MILVFLSLAINFRPLVLRLYKNYETEKVAETHPFVVGQCLVQYDICAFNKEKEPWQHEGCSPFKSFFKLNQVGQRKYLVTEFFKDGKRQMKELDKLDVHRLRDGADSDKNYYPIECSEVEINWELEDSAAAPAALNGQTNFDALVNKCIVTENDCNPENMERWELESYCHPYDLVYKVLENGTNKIRVESWNGHANDKVTQQIVNVGVIKSFNKAEYDLIDFKEVDCDTLAKRFPKNFNSITGRVQKNQSMEKEE